MFSPVYTQTRATLARIRCLQECIECFRDSKELPEALCYVPSGLEFKLSPTATRLNVYKNPDRQAECINTLTSETGNENTLYVAGLAMCNSQGQWLKIERPVEGWVLLYDSKASQEDPPTLQPVEINIASSPCQKACDSVKFKELQKSVTGTRLFTFQLYELTIIDQKKSFFSYFSWEEVIEVTYSLRIGKLPTVRPAHMEGVENLRTVPPVWSLECDEELARFLGEHTDHENEKLGSVKQYVESVDVSSSWDDESASCLTDGDPTTYWESDGRQGQHWIRLGMRRGTIIKKLFITVNAHDDNYMPTHVVVMAGDREHLVKLSDHTIEQTFSGDICILEDMTQFYSTVEIRIKSCKDDGVDTRIHGIKIKSLKERDLGLNIDLFDKKELVRYPRLELIDKEKLYQRALVLQRFIKLLDSVIHFIVPAWEYSVGSFRSLEVVRQFLPLSKKRNGLIHHFLSQSETGRPSRMPRLYINRRSAADHRIDPFKDPSAKNSIFSQMYEGLKPKDKFEKPLDFRWPQQYDQWWECKFLSEGIIDQGGGFRDSLADLAEELCPTGKDDPIPLPFFIRSPNQNNDDSNINRDVYLPNPSCRQFAKYEWIGMLMGACLRSREHLVLSLPAFVWKLMGYEHVTWSRDFKTVDAAAVKMIELIESMDRETFEASFAGELTYTTSLSDQTIVPLKDGCTDTQVLYDDRNEYCRLVKKARMNECTEQVESLRQGLLKVIPQAVLDLLTWQELERKICGDPMITVEDLKKTTFYEDIEELDVRVKYLWEALTKFTHEDRSRFLRFVTGRRRLPAPLYICPDRGDKVDALPESSTCSNTLFLPVYSSAKITEEKLRYAAYNCVAIDTDMSPWDE
ncbi:E3 ubiquitin-protein ligase HECTD3-like [Lytechinus variegatus]|uniref:E3 ubiquitin-protein ligase HECTD3-like n=1 Tax=Lytechinus variegatus TaxID=7654 RepID=UPI001BB2162B|nr:E3 ubiquitin-protein ligase HECTD3-like [Lytechinus variegatus]